MLFITQNFLFTLVCSQIQKRGSAAMCKEFFYEDTDDYDYYIIIIIIIIIIYERFNRISPLLCWKYTVIMEVL